MVMQSLFPDLKHTITQHSFPGSCSSLIIPFENTLISPTTMARNTGGSGCGNRIAQKSLEVMNYNDEGTLSCCLDLWSRYLDAEREMLQRRTCLLIEYESANRNLDKAKGSKREEVSLSESSFLSLPLHHAVFSMRAPQYTLTT